MSGTEGLEVQTGTDDGQSRVIKSTAGPGEKMPLQNGPIPGVKYPVQVVYCGECGFVLIINGNLADSINHN